jgi:hypothetical protein
VVTPTSTTGGDSGSDVPWWGWLLIALGAIGVGIGIFSLAHHSGGAAASGQPPPGHGPPPPGGPPVSPGPPGT